jgi:hypothetical protein
VSFVDEIFMPAIVPHILEALRLPELYREICVYAGIPLPSGAVPPERFVIRSGPESPELFAKLLEEAFAEDEAEIAIDTPDAPADLERLGPGAVVIRPGFDAPCPDGAALRPAVRPAGGPALVFAVERRDAHGRLLGLIWAAVPEEEPDPQAPFRAAVCRHDVAANP